MNKDQLAFLTSLTTPKGTLDSSGKGPPDYVQWFPDNPRILLDGRFTADELEAIVWFMRGGPNRVGSPGSIPCMPARTQLTTPQAKPSYPEHRETFKGLTTRTMNALYAEGIYTPAKLLEYYQVDKETLRRPISFVPSIGAKGIIQMHAWLRARGEL